MRPYKDTHNTHSFLHFSSSLCPSKFFFPCSHKVTTALRFCPFWMQSSLMKFLRVMIVRERWIRLISDSWMPSEFDTLGALMLCCVRIVIQQCFMAVRLYRRGALRILFFGSLPTYRGDKSTSKYQSHKIFPEVWRLSKTTAEEHPIGISGRLSSQGGWYAILERCWEYSESPSEYW